jgi:hypothetical protein
MAMSDSSSKDSMDMPDDSIASVGASDESNPIDPDHNGRSEESMSNDHDNGQTEIMDMNNVAVHGSEIDNFKIKASNPQKERAIEF